ncbi:P27 family phage terminase small subunit [Alcanivorax quisquiliarum]|uniref:P27 family phage terminase small subunit n=1 Tax=Alcanivorax quisquiliarum TaxID=2933565 RepID=UPI00352E68DC
MATKITPPKSLGTDGRKLWAELRREYEITDAGSLAILRSMCESVDRLNQCREAVARDGLVVAGSGGQPRPHPLLQVEAEARRALLAHSRALRLDLSGDF